MFQLSCRSSSLSRPTRSRCQMRIVLNFSVWTEVLMRLPVEETRRPISGSLNGHPLPACSAEKETHSVDNKQVPETKRAEGQPLPQLRGRIFLNSAAAATDGFWDAAASSSTQQLTDWRRDASWQSEPKSQNDPSRPTGPEDASNNDPKSQNFCKHFRGRSFQLGVPSSSRVGALAVSLLGAGRFNIPSLV